MFYSNVPKLVQNPNLRVKNDENLIYEMKPASNFTNYGNHNASLILNKSNNSLTVNLNEIFQKNYDHWGKKHISFRHYYIDNVKVFE